MRLSEACILVVDDEEILRDYLGRWFEREGATVYRAGQGEEALALLDRHPIDLIVSDIRMPVLDGVEMLKKIRAEGRPRPSVIFVSGFNDYEERELFDLGAEALLAKPFDRERLIGCARNSLAGREELWHTPVELAPGRPTVTRVFESLRAALDTGEIAFGRGGFCLQTPRVLPRGPVGLDLQFQDEGYVLAGSGIVRWMVPQEQQAGIELAYLEEPSRDRVTALTSQSACFIPSTARIAIGTP